MLKFTAQICVNVENFTKYVPFLPLISISAHFPRHLPFLTNNSIKALTTDVLLMKKKAIKTMINLYFMSPAICDTQTLLHSYPFGRVLVVSHLYNHFRQVHRKICPDFH